MKVLVVLLLQHASTQPTHQKVGRMVTPTELGVVHFFRSPDDIAAAINRTTARLTELDDLSERSPGKFKKRFQELKIKATRKLHSLQRELDKLQKTVSHDEHKKRRVRRVAPLVVGVGVALGVGLLVGVVALGFGITSYAELGAIENRVSSLENEQGRLISELDERFKAANRNFNRINGSLSDMEWELIYAEQRNLAVSLLDELQDRIKYHQDGYYHAMQGVLHPTFVSFADLEKGLAKMEEQVKGRGMRVVPFERPIQSFFSMPITTVVNGTGLHMYVSVPLMPAAAPEFEVLKVQHPPVAVGQGVFIEFALEKEYVVTDRRRELSVDVSSAELAVCKQFQDTFFCQISTFSRHPRSCAAALLHGDKATASRVCQKRVLKEPVVVLPVGNQSFDVDVYSTRLQTVVTVCPGEQEQEMARFQGLKRIPLKEGCFLRTTSTTTFKTTRPPMVDVACSVPLWQGDELLEGLEPEDISEYLQDMNLESVLVDLAWVKGSVADSQNAFLTLIAGASTVGLVGAVFVSLMLRYLYLWYQIRTAVVAN